MQLLHSQRIHHGAEDSRAAFACVNLFHMQPGLVMRQPYLPSSQALYSLRSSA